MAHRRYRPIDLRVPCPYCDAPRDYWCQIGHITARTHYAWEPHAARARAADEQVLQARAGTAIEDDPGQYRTSSVRRGSVTAALRSSRYRA